MIEHLGATPVLMRVYSCRYAPQGSPHYHIGHLGNDDMKQLGRMPARKPGRKRRHSR